MNCKSFYRELCESLSPVSPDAPFEAGELLRHFCGISTVQRIAGTAEIPVSGCAAARAAVGRRLEGYPLQYLLGEWDFYGRTFRVGEGVLIPRADTETLVEAALAFAKGRGPLRIADLCSGSGCIAVTLAKELPSAEVWAVEKSPEALGYLRGNAAQNGASLHILRDDVLAPTGDYPTFDLIVSNPPYLTQADMDSLQPEVRHEPAMALFGETDGLAFYRGITERWTERLNPGGMVAYEIGLGQENAVAEMLKNKCLRNVCFHRDLCGIIRVITGTKKPFPSTSNDKSRRNGD